MKQVKGKMKTRFFISIFGMALAAGACASTFLVGKGQHAYFLESNSKAKYDMLCVSGDLEKVLAFTHLSTEIKDSFYKYNCSAERSSDKIKQLYASLTVEQRKDIESAFRKNGYDINLGR